MTVFETGMVLTGAVVVLLFVVLGMFRYRLTTHHPATWTTLKRPKAREPFAEVNRVLQTGAYRSLGDPALTSVGLAVVWLRRLVMTVVFLWLVSVSYERSLLLLALVLLSFALAILVEHRRRRSTPGA